MKRKSTNYRKQLLGQPPFYVSGSVSTDSFINELPYFDVSVSHFLWNKALQVGAVKETNLPDKHKETLPKGLRITIRV